MSSLLKTLSVIGGLTILGAATALSACTVTSSSGGLDGSVTPSGDSGSNGDSSTTSDSSTTTDSGGGDGGSCKLPNNVTFGPQACDCCMAQKCSTAVDGCYNDQDCVALNDCINGCVGDGGAIDQACVNACGSAHPNSQAKFNAVTDCLTASCNAECP